MFLTQSKLTWEKITYFQNYFKVNILLTLEQQLNFVYKNSKFFKCLHVLLLQLYNLNFIMAFFTADKTFIKSDVICQFVCTSQEGEQFI